MIFGVSFYLRLRFCFIFLLLLYFFLFCLSPSSTCNSLPPFPAISASTALCPQLPSKTNPWLRSVHLATFARRAPPSRGLALLASITQITWPRPAISAKRAATAPAMETRRWSVRVCPASSADPALLIPANTPVPRAITATQRSSNARPGATVPWPTEGRERTACSVQVSSRV